MGFKLNSGNALSNKAFDDEFEKLRALEKIKRREAAFLTTEGEGIAEAGIVKSGDELDLEDLTEEERRRRSTGRVSRDIGLLL